MSDAGLILPAGIKADDASFDAFADAVAAKIAAGMKEGFKDLSKELRALSNQIIRAFNLGRIGDQFEAATRAARRTGRAGREAGEDMRKGFKSAADAADELEKDLLAIRQLAEAQRKRGFADPGDFAALNRSLQKLAEFQRKVRASGTDRATQSALRKELDTIRQFSVDAREEFRSSARDRTVLAGKAAEASRAAEERIGRQKLVELQKQSAIERAQFRRTQDQILSDTQRSNKQRVQITRAALETIGRAERALGASIAGIARTASSAAARIYGDTLGRLPGLFRRNNAQINQIVSQGGTSRNSIFRSSLVSQERILQQSVTRQGRIIQAAQAQAQTGAIGTARRSNLFAAAGGLGAAGFLAGGLSRFSDLERLNKQFLALTGSAETTAQLMGEIKEFAKTTSFDLVGVADLAKGFLAIKTPADQVLPRVRAISDAVALTGGGVDELNRIQRAIGQVVSAGRLQGDELNQLAENLPGLNIREILAQQLTGGDVAALVKLQGQGKISADDFVTGFITGISGDTRLQGAAQDAASTLSGRIANLKESFQDLGASVIGTVAGPLKTAVLILQTTFQGLAEFVKGNVSPELQALRVAAAGAAVGIGALLVAKGAGEALKILSTSLKLVFTPLGLLVTVFGVAGAAIAVARNKSEEFREVTDRLVKLLRSTAGRVFESIGNAIEKVRDAFTKVPERVDQTADAFERSLKPVRSWISEVGTKIGDAISTAGRFITDTLIPAIADLVIWLGQRLGPVLTVIRDVTVDLAQKGFKAIGTAIDFITPKLQTFVGLVGEAANGAKEAVAGGAGILGPLLGIGGGALAGAVVGGPVGAIVGAFAGGLATLSPTIRKTIVDGFKGAVDEVTGFISNIDWPGLASGALKFVEKVGFILGSIVSDRRFVAALAGIVAAATAIAGKFVIGFARGVISNVGELAELGSQMAEVIIAGIADFITDPDNLLSSLLIAAGIFGGTRILRQFTTVGEKMGKAISGGITSGFSATRGGGDFFGALFGGTNNNNFQRSARKAAEKAQAALETEFRRINSTLRQGGSVGVGLAPGARATQVDLDAARTQFDRLNTQIGASAVAGLRLRAAFADTFNSIRSGAGGVTGAFSAIKTGAGDALNALRGQGAKIGAALGAGVAGAFASAVGGQQLAKGNTAAGLGTILISSLTTGLAIGGPAGAAVGGLVAGFGLLTAAFASSGEAAKKAAELTREFRDAVIEAGNAGKDVAPSLLEVLGENLSEASQGTVDALAGVGLELKDILDVAGDSAAVTKVKKASEALKDFADASSSSAQVFSDERLGAALAAVGEVGGKAGDAFERLLEQFRNGEVSNKDFSAALSFVADQAAAAEASISSAASFTKVYGEQAALTAEQVSALNQATSAQIVPLALEGARNIAEELRDRAREAEDAVRQLLNPTEGTLASQINDLVLSLSSIGTSLQTGLDDGGRIGAAGQAQALEDLRSRVSEVVSAGLNEGISEARIDADLAQLIPAIDELEISDQAKASLRAEIQKAIDTDLPEVKILLDQSGITDATDDLRDAFERGGRASPTKSIGQNMVQGIIDGINSKIKDLERVASSVGSRARTATSSALKISSPSRVYVEIGQQTVAGYVNGITQSLGDVTNAAAGIASAATGGTSAALVEDLKAAQRDFLSNVFAGSSGVDSSRRSVISGIQGLISQASGNENRNLGLSLEGVENRGLIASAVDAIKALAPALFETGLRPGEIGTELANLRQQLLDTGTFVGFDRSSLDALISELGLSQGAIARIVNELDHITVAAAETTDAATEAQEAAADGGTTVNIESINLAFPYGDPEAISLRVANSIATGVRR